MCLVVLSLGCCGALWITTSCHKEMMFQSAIRQSTTEPFLVDKLSNVVHSHPLRVLFLLLLLLLLLLLFLFLII